MDAAPGVANPVYLSVLNVSGVGNSGAMNINGTANTYAGGTIVGINNNMNANNYQPGIVNVASGSVLGTGNATVLAGGELQLNALTNLASGKKVTVQSNGFSAGMLGITFNSDPSSIIDPTSQGVLSLNVATFSTAITNPGQLFVGGALTNTAVSYTAATLGTPDGIYRVGGGYGALTITNPSNNIFTGTNSLVIGQSVYNGGGNTANAGVTINNSNNFSGGTTVDLMSSTLTVANAGGLGTGGLNVESGTVNFTAGATQSLTGAVLIQGGTVNASIANVLGTGSLTVNNGTLVLTTAQATNTGTTVIAGGTVTANTVAGSLGTNPITFSGGTINAGVTGAMAATTITMSGGTLNATAANALTGTMSMSGGTLNATVANAITGSNLTTTGGTVNSSVATGLGAATNNLSLGGTLNITGADQTYNNLTVNSALLINANTNLTFTGNVTQGANTLTIANTAFVTNGVSLPGGVVIVNGTTTGTGATIVQGTAGTGTTANTGALGGAVRPQNDGRRQQRQPQSRRRRCLHPR